MAKCLRTIQFGTVSGDWSPLHRVATLQSDACLAEAHNTLAQFLAGDYKFAEADSEFKRVIALNPNYALAHHWYGLTLLETGRLEESLEETRRAEELDPLSPAVASNMAFAYALLGDEAESENRIRKLKELDPANNFLDFALALVAAAKDDFGKAVSHMEDALKAHPQQHRVLFVVWLLSCEAGEAGKSGRGAGKNQWFSNWHVREAVLAGDDTCGPG